MVLEGYFGVNTILHIDLQAISNVISHRLRGLGGFTGLGRFTGLNRLIRHFFIYALHISNGTGSRIPVAGIQQANGRRCIISIGIIVGTVQLCDLQSHTVIAVAQILAVDTVVLADLATDIEFIIAVILDPIGTQGCHVQTAIIADLVLEGYFGVNTILHIDLQAISNVISHRLRGLGGFTGLGRFTGLNRLIRHFFIYALHISNGTGSRIPVAGVQQANGRRCIVGIGIVIGAIQFRNLKSHTEPTVAQILAVDTIVLADLATDIEFIIAVILDPIGTQGCYVQTAIIGNLVLEGNLGVNTILHIDLYTCANGILAFHRYIGFMTATLSYRVGNVTNVAVCSISICCNIQHGNHVRCIIGIGIVVGAIHQGSIHGHTHIAILQLLSNNTIVFPDITICIELIVAKILAPIIVQRSNSQNTFVGDFILKGDCSQVLIIIQRNDLFATSCKSIYGCDRGLAQFQIIKPEFIPATGHKAIIHVYTQLHSGNLG